MVPLNFLFEDHVLDVRRRELRRGGAVVEVEPQVFDLLVFLVESRDRVVTKDDLYAAVWRGRIVSESTLTSRINAARNALGDSGAEQRLIRTLPRKGFRFVGPVSVEDPVAPSVVEPPPSVPSAPPAAPPDRPSIAVLPFGNWGGDDAQEYFVDGITEDLITALSKWRSFLVIARNSTFIYKGRAVDVRQVARELGVRYVLEGSVRRAANRVRLTAQLIDAASGAHVWAERYDRELADIFDIQDDLTLSVAAAVGHALTDSEADLVRRKRPEDMTAWDHYLRGMWHFYRLNPTDSAQGIACFRRANAEDPGLADALAGLARALFSRIAYGFPGDRDAMMREAAEAARGALALDSQMAQACYVLALVTAHSGDPDAGIDHARRAVELNANFAGGYFALAVASSFAGRPREALAAIDMALRLNPHDPQRFAWLAQRASALYLDGRYEEAAETARRSLALRWYQTSSRILAAALARLGDVSAARSVAAELMASPIGEKSIAEAVRPFKREVDRENYAVGLRASGMPEG